MSEVQYTITNKALNNIVKIESYKFLAEPQTGYPLRNRLIQRTKSLSIFHLAHMHSLQITLKDAEKVAEGKRLEGNDPRYFMLYNFRNVLDYNRSTVGDENYLIDANLLMHLNKVVLSDWRETWDVRWRSNEDAMDDKVENWFDLHDTTLTDEQIEQGVYAVAEWYAANLTRLHPLVLYCVVIYDLVRLAPLAAGNKLTLLALADYMLARFGYSEKSGLSLTRLMDKYEQEFYEAWQIATKTNDITIWLERFTSALAKELQENKAEIDLMVSEEEKSSSKPFLDLNRRQLKVLRYLQTIPTVKREDYCQMMEVSTMTAFRDLNDLVSKKLIKIEGRGRGTKYMLATR